VWVLFLGFRPGLFLVFENGGCFEASEPTILSSTMVNLCSLSVVITFNVSGS